MPKPQFDLQRLDPHDPDLKFQDSPGSTPSPRAFWWVVAAFLAVILAVGAQVPGIVAALPSSGIWPFSNTKAHVVAQLRAIDGIASVGKGETRAGDLTLRDNLFFTVTPDANLDDDGIDTLVATIGSSLADLQGSTRVLVELDVNSYTVGISPIADLNPQRVSMARRLAGIDGVVRATVLWPNQGDNLIYDETNNGLDVAVQSVGGSAGELRAAAALLLESDLPTSEQKPRITAVVLGANHPRERLYSWTYVDGAQRGERTTSIDLSDPDAVLMMERMDDSPHVIGYSIDDYGITIALAPAVDPTLVVAELGVPDRWTSIRVLSTTDGSWTTESVDP